MDGPEVDRADSDGRVTELVGTLGAVRARIAAICSEQGRDPRQITLVAVTKTYPASDVVALARLGVHDIGENRDQEAAQKVSDVRELRVDAGPGVAPEPLRWHFLGRIQSRKCRSIASYAQCVHALDRASIAERLARAVEESGRDRLEVFLQVSLDGDPARGGVPAAGVQALADDVAAHPQLRLLGLMAVAPLGADPDTAFAALAEQAARVRRDHPEAAAISAGMSGDLEAALRHGATHLRVGSALLGRRGPLID